MLRLLVKALGALEKLPELTLIEAPIICLTRFQSLLRPVISIALARRNSYQKKNSICLSIVQESPIHGFLFWIGISVLQLENEQLFETGLALIEQNLHINDSHGVFEKVISSTVR